MIRRLLGPVSGPILYLLVAGLVFAGLGWVTVAALRVEAAQRQAAARADREKDVQGALWRLDGRVLPALGVEDSRPFYHYTNYAPDDPITAYGPPCAPLLAAELPAWTRLHFQVDPDAGWQSPQVLAAEAADRLRQDWPGLDPRNATPERARLVAALRARFPTRAVIDVFAARERAVPSGTGPLPEWLFVDVPPPAGGPPAAEPPTATGPAPGPPPAELPPVALPPGAAPASEAQSAPVRERRALEDGLKDSKDRAAGSESEAAKKKDLGTRDIGPPPPAPVPSAPGPRAAPLPDENYARAQSKVLPGTDDGLRGGFYDRSESSKRALEEARRMAPPSLQQTMNLAQNQAQNQAVPGFGRGLARSYAGPPVGGAAPAPAAKPGAGLAGGFGAQVPGTPPPAGPVTSAMTLAARAGRPPAAAAGAGPSPPAGADSDDKSSKGAAALAKKAEAPLMAAKGATAPKPVSPTGRPEADDGPAGDAERPRPTDLGRKAAGLGLEDKAAEGVNRGFFKQIDEFRGKKPEQLLRNTQDEKLKAGEGLSEKEGLTPGGQPGDRLAGKALSAPRPDGLMRASPFPGGAGGGGGGFLPPARPKAPAAQPPGGPAPPPGPGGGPVPPTPDPAPPEVLEPAQPPASGASLGGLAGPAGPPRAARGDEPPAPAEPPPSVTVHLGSMHPQWLTAADGTEILVLVRAARLESKTVYQGIVLDWPKLQEVLTEEIKDQFPNARLLPVKDPAGVARERAMTALPAQLDPGPAPEPPPPGWTPLRLGLLLAWTAAVIAFAAVGLCGWSLIDLAERRIRFVSAVTHELRTPLTSLRLYIDLLLSGMVQDEEKRKEYLSTLNAESDRLHRLIDNVLDFARLERRRKGGDVQPVKVADLLELVRRTWADRCATDGKELVVISTLPPEQEVCTDAGLVQQVVGNLIDNARKYTRDASDTRIWLWAKLDGPRRVVLEVEDRGAGVPPREQKLIFRPFRRGEAADTKAGGAGLGLALSKQWAEVLGGRLTYRPADGGVGSCFRLELAVK